MPSDRSVVRREHRHRDYRAEPRYPLVVAVDNVDKASNLGGILRAAEAFMVERVITDREEPDIAGAMGAERWQPVEWAVNLLGAIHEYRQRGYAVVALEQMPEAVSLARFSFPRKALLVVGAEMFGVSEPVLRAADAVVFIPQAGLVKSLNVVAAATVAMFEYSRQHWMSEHIQSPRHLAPASQSLRVKGVRQEPAVGTQASRS